MMDWLNLAIISSSIVLTILLLAAALLNRNFSECTNRWYFTIILLNLLTLSCEIGIGMLIGQTGRGPEILIRALDFFSYVWSSLQFIAFARYLHACASSRKKAFQKLLSIVTILSTFSILLAVIAQFTHLYASFDASNTYHQHSLYRVAFLFSSTSMIIVLIVVMQNRQALPLRSWISLLVYASLMLLCYLIESIVPGLWISYLGATIACFIIYINIQLERIHQKDQELMNSRINLMLSQIQPHFLFNTLTAIDSLYPEDSQAHTALITFSQYLRVNMESLVKKTPVQFQQELSHVQQYLWLEGLRFGNRLTIHMEIEADQFHIPALTLQPLVENAIRHGLMKRQEGGTLLIRTQEDAEAFFVLVRDDGVGFDPNAPINDGQSHTGIANTRARVEAMCGGYVSIDSIPGQGTTALIVLPKKRGGNP